MGSRPPDQTPLASLEDRPDEHVNQEVEVTDGDYSPPDSPCFRRQIPSLKSAKPGCGLQPCIE